MTQAVETSPRFISGKRPLRTVVEDPRRIPYPTSDQELNILRDTGLSDAQIFDQTRIKPKRDYSYGGGPIFSFDYSGTTFEHVRRIVPERELSQAQRKFLQLHGYHEVAELTRFDKRWRRTRHILWVPVVRQPVEAMAFT